MKKQKISIKTVDGSRYDLPSGNIPTMSERCGFKWLVVSFPDKAYWINIINVVCITEKDDEGNGT